MKKLLFLLCCFLIAWFLFSSLRSNTQARMSGSSAHVATSSPPTPQTTGPYTVTGPPTINASFINRALKAYGSPASGTGQALYDLGVKYGIDPVYALAFFLHESRFGTTGEATVTLSLGNERCIQDRPCIDVTQGGYAQMRSWEDGFEHWYMLILYGYVQGRVTRSLVGHNCSTIDQIIPVYVSGTNQRNIAAYIATIKYAVHTWRSGSINL